MEPGRGSEPLTRFRGPLKSVLQVFDMSTLYFVNLPVSSTGSSRGEKKGILTKFKRLSRI